MSIIPGYVTDDVVFAKGDSKKEGVNYEGGRTEKDLVDYLNEKAGTHRLVGGSLSDSAGRIVDLDSLVEKLASASTKDEESSVYTELEQVLSKLTSTYIPRSLFSPLHISLFLRSKSVCLCVGRAAKYYGKVIEKVKKDPQYPMKERVRLEAIVAKGSLASEKYQSLSNIPPTS